MSLYRKVSYGTEPLKVPPKNIQITTQNYSKELTNLVRLDKLRRDNSSDLLGYLLSWTLSFPYITDSFIWWWEKVVFKWWIIYSFIHFYGAWAFFYMGILVPWTYLTISWYHFWFFFNTGIALTLGGVPLTYKVIVDMLHAYTLKYLTRNV